MLQIEFGVLLIVLLVAWLRLESRFNEAIQQAKLIADALGLIQDKMEEIGDSISSIAVNVATRK
jgi:sensor domain CHASE-containing protein